jgi:hypothetical protein
MRDEPGDDLIVTEDDTRKKLPTIKKVSSQKKQLILKCLLALHPAPGGMRGEPGDVLIVTEDDPLHLPVQDIRIVLHQPEHSLPVKQFLTKILF